MPRRCERCLAPDFRALSAVITRPDARVRAGHYPGRRLLWTDKLDLCEACIKDLVKALEAGRVAFSQEGDAPEPTDVPIATPGASAAASNGTQAATGPV